MNSGSKDGRSFREARTSTEEAEAIQKAIPCSTRYKNKWAVDVFKEWQYYRATKSQTSDEVAQSCSNKRRSCSKSKFQMCLEF